MWLTYLHDERMKNMEISLICETDWPDRRRTGFHQRRRSVHTLAQDEIRMS